MKNFSPPRKEKNSAESLKILNLFLRYGIGPFFGNVYKKIVSGRKKAAGNRLHDLCRKYGINNADGQGAENGAKNGNSHVRHKKLCNIQYDRREDEPF